MLTSFVLGLLTAINPCQLAINLSALTFLLQHGDKELWPQTSTKYILGRTITYVLLAVVLAQFGASLLQQIDPGKFRLIERVMPFLLFAFALVFIAKALHPHKQHSDCHHTKPIIKGIKHPLILGLLLALAFCPESAVLYFGVMLPNAIQSAHTILWPVAYAIGAALPPALIALLMGKGQKKMNRFQRISQKFYPAMNILIAAAFILTACYILFAE